MKRSTVVISSLIAVAAGAVAGFILVEKLDVKDKLSDRLQGIYQSTQQKVSGMSEDVAVRTAKLTNNPKITQDWVSKQWDALDY